MLPLYILRKRHLLGPELNRHFFVAQWFLWLPPMLCYLTEVCFSRDDERDPFFHVSMVQNPWSGLEEDFEEVKEELLENADELVLTIPMSMSSWMRTRRQKSTTKMKPPRMPVGPSSTDDKSWTANGSIVELFETMRQIESQLAQEPPTTEANQNTPPLLPPSEFQKRSSLETAITEQTSDIMSPLLPSSFQRNSSSVEESSVLPVISGDSTTSSDLTQPSPQL